VEAAQATQARRKHAREDLEQRRFAGAIGSNDCDDFRPSARPSVTTRENRLLTVREPHVVSSEQRRHGSLRSSQRKNGPPTSVVTTPTGSSAGRATVRAPDLRVPKGRTPSADAGKSTRYRGSEPTHDVRCHESDKADDPHEGDSGRSGQARAHYDADAYGPWVSCQRPGRVLTELERVQALASA